MTIQVKDSQPTLHQQAKALCASAVPLLYVSRRDQGRKRREKRGVAVFDAIPAVLGTRWSPLVSAVIHVECDVLSRSTSTGLRQRPTEIAFYLASSVIPAARAAAAIRDH